MENSKNKTPEQMTTAEIAQAIRDLREQTRKLLEEARLRRQSGQILGNSEDKKIKR